MAALCRHFYTAKGEEINVPTALLFFGREEFISTASKTSDAPVDASSQEREAKEALQKRIRLAEQEEDRLALDLEVGLYSPCKTTSCAWRYF